MADVKTTTYTTGYSDTMKDDILDVITNISPTDTPLLSAMGKTKAESTNHLWPVDELEPPSNNAQVEGADVDAEASTPPSTENNYTQISTKSFSISDTAERVKKYGRKKESAYQMAKKLKELARDMEYAAVNNATKSSGAAGSARQAMGAQGFISTNDNSFSSFADTNDLTESLFNDTMQLAWAEGGDVDLVLAPPVQKRIISGFDGFNTLTKNANAASKKVVAKVDFYEGDFGTVAIVPHRHIAPEVDTTPEPDVEYDTVLMLQKDLWKLATLGPVTKEPLARTGMARKYLISTEYTFECRAEKGNSKIGKLSRV